MIKLEKDELIKKAYEFAKISLAGKKRYSGEYFVDHCIKVSETLIKFRITDPCTISVAILHHSCSNGAATLDDIEKEFGGDIANMIKNLDGLRVIKLPALTNTQFIEGLRKMFLVLAEDMRVVLIKLADILDNLTTLQYIPSKKQKEVAKETIEIFAPLAERLGMGEIKGQMQDLAFEYLYPKEFERVSKILHTKKEEFDKMLLKTKGELRLALKKEGIEYEIESRTKHLYSLFTKLSRPEIDFDISKVYDLIAFRIIVHSNEDCYRTLGIVHKLWRPMPNYVRDYIAHPKPNGYQSIHTTVLGPHDKPFEIQIRTSFMHEQAEYGVAAHWNYSEAKSTGATDKMLSKGVVVKDGKLKWVKLLSSWQEEVVDNEEFLKTVKTDFFGERIFVFTPKGDVKDLPLGATPIDFAYAVHTTLGDITTSARINGKMVSLDYKLKNGDMVEILVSKDKKKKPNKDWLKFVVTTEAKKRIKKAFLE